MQPPLLEEENAEVVDDYWRESRRPLVSLAFVSPLLIAYEGGILLLGPEALRNGAEVWLRSFLEMMGFGQYFLLPALTVGLLLGWHHVMRDRWYIPLPVLQGMAGECTCYALLLVVFAYLQSLILNALLPNFLLFVTPLFGNAIGEFFARVIGFFGAGIYEEVLFRLMLLTGFVGIFHFFGMPPRRASWSAIAVSSFLFSLAHYVGAHGDVFSFYSFFFRFVAGAFFAVLFVRRGFGIAAGTHAFYDVAVGLL